MERSVSAPGTLAKLVGSGDKIMLAALPFLVVGVVLNILFPAIFEVGGPGTTLRTVALVILAIGVPLWLWSAVLVIVRVPAGRLITGGPFAVVKHPLYTSVGLLVLPWAGLLLNTWLGVVIGLVIYLAARTYRYDEEQALAATFGRAWHEYARLVLLPWV